MLLIIYSFSYKIFEYKLIICCISVFIFNFFKNWACVFICVSLCGYVHVSAHAFRSQRDWMLLDPELLLRVVVSQGWMLGREFGYTARMINFINPWAISSGPITCFNIKNTNQVDHSQIKWLKLFVENSPKIRAQTTQ